MHDSPALEFVHITIPFGIQGSTLMSVAQSLTDVAERGGRATGAVLSHNRELTFDAADVRYVDYTTVCPREWFTPGELAQDVLSGKLGRLRPHYGHLMDPAIEAVSEMKSRVALVYAGHYAEASLPQWQRVRGETAVVLYVHSPLSRTYGRRELNRLLAGADMIAFAGDHLRRATEQRLGRSDGRLVSAPNGVDPFFLEAPVRDRSPGVFEVLYAGRIWPNKGVHLMLEAVERAAALTSRPLRARVIGSADYVAGSPLTRYEESLRARAAGMSVDVEFVTFVDRATLRDYLEGAAVACLPSLWAEARPLAALEAMATGLPIITSDSPGMKEAVGAAGVVVPGGDPDVTARAIARMADDEDAWLESSAASRTHALGCRWESVVEVLSSVRAV